MSVRDSGDGTGWVGDVALNASLEQRLQRLCDAFNQSPFCKLIGLNMQVVHGEIQAVLDMQPSLIGNVAYEILHGGVAASVLDSIGGIVAMGEIYRRNEGELIEQISKVSRLATIDMRVDYLRPGRGHEFVATAQVLRMGRKGCIMRMDMVDHEGQLIATGTAAYGY